MKKKNNLTKELKLKKTIIAKLTPKEMGRVVGGFDKKTDKTSSLMCTMDTVLTNTITSQVDV